MKIIDEALNGLKLVEVPIYGDSRGFFCERYVQDKFHNIGIDNDFVQDNLSRSVAGVVRGLHYQTNPAQAKLVGCVMGKILDVAVDIRISSPTFGQYYAAELSADNGRLLHIPAGFAHGFSVLGEDDAIVSYKVDGGYNASGEGSILYNDSDINIDWKVDNPAISERDKQGISLAEYKNNPVFK